MQIEVPLVGGPMDGRKIIFQTMILIVGTKDGAGFYVAETKGPLQIPVRYVHQPSVFVAVESDFTK